MSNFAHYRDLGYPASSTRYLCAMTFAACLGNNRIGWPLWALYTTYEVLPYGTQQEGCQLYAANGRGENGELGRLCRQADHPLLLSQGGHSGLHDRGLRIPR